MAAFSPSVRVPSVAAPIASALADPPRPSVRVAPGGGWSAPDPAARVIDRRESPTPTAIASPTEPAWPAPDPAMLVSTIPPAPTRYALPARVLIEPALQVDHQVVTAGTGLDTTSSIAPPSDTTVRPVDPFSLPPDPATRREIGEVRAESADREGSRLRWKLIAGVAGAATVAGAAVAAVAAVL